MFDSFESIPQKSNQKINNSDSKNSGSNGIFVNGLVSVNYHR